MKFDYFKLRMEWKRRRYTDKEIAELIGVSPRTIAAKNSGEIERELTATQVAVICAEIGTTFEMFVTKEEDND